MAITRQWFVHTPMGEYVVRVAHVFEHAPDPAVARLVWFYAESALENLEPSAVAGALSLHREFTGRYTQVPGDQRDRWILDEVRRDLERAVDSSRLVFELVPPPATRARMRRAPSLRPAAEREEVLDFVEFVLLDEDDVPVSQCEFTIELTDGSAVSGKLDARGSARFDEIPSGSCRMSFTELDGEAWGYPEKCARIPTGVQHVFRLRKRIDYEAQAKTMIVAAIHAIPFCEECEKARRKADDEAARKRSAQNAA